MKKLLVLVALVGTLVFSCNLNADWPEYINVYNTSNYPVTFKILNRNDDYAVPIGGNISIKRTPRFSIDTQSIAPYKRVIFSSENFSYTFKNRDGFQVQIINGLGIPATLNADGWMEPITITDTSVNVQTDPSWLVYTNNPVFTVNPNNGFEADVAVSPREEGEPFKVTLRW